MVDLDPDIAQRLAAFAGAPPARPLDVGEVARRAGRRRRRRHARRAFAGSAVVAAVLALAAVTARDGEPADVDASGTAGPAAEVTPAEGLTDGQEVELRTTGLPEASSAAMCAADVTPESLGRRCDGRTTTPLARDGAGPAPFQVVRTLDIAGQRRDCAAPATPCAVAVGTLDGPIAVVPVTFDPDRAILVPALSVTSPPGGARDGDTVEVSGTGFVPGAEVPVVQCDGAAESSGCMSLTTATYVADADGAFAGTMRVTRRLDTTAGTTDCAAEPCRLVTESPTTDPVSRPVAFAPPDGPLADPTLTVSPAGPHAPGDVVAVTGTGFARHAAIDVTLCAGSPDDPATRACIGSAGGTATTDDAGAFALDAYTLPADPFDCTGGCYLAYAPAHFPTLAHAPITLTR